MANALVENEKQKPHWPPLFVAIIETQHDRRRLMVRCIASLDGHAFNHHPPSPAEWIELKRLLKEMQAFRKAARAFLRWDPTGNDNGTAGAICL